MPPRFEHGQLLFVDPSRPPAKGDDVIIQVKDGETVMGLVKRFKSGSDDKTAVSQFNPAQDITFATADVIAVHLVVGSLAAGR